MLVMVSGEGVLVKLTVIVVTHMVVMVTMVAVVG